MSFDKQCPSFAMLQNPSTRQETYSKRVFTILQENKYCGNSMERFHQDASHEHHNLFFIEKKDKNQHILHRIKNLIPSLSIPYKINENIL